MSTQQQKLQPIKTELTPAVPQHFNAGTTTGQPNVKGTKDFLALLWPEKWFVLSCALLCAAMAFFASCFQTPEYKAKTSLEIEDLNGRFMQLNEVDPVSKGSNSDAYLSTQVDILSSNALLSRVISRLHLDELNKPKTDTGFLKQIKQKLNFSKLPPPSPRESAMADLKKNLDISAPRGTSRVVTVEFVSPDPKLAAAVPNTLAQELLDQGIELRIQSAKSLSKWLTKELEQSRQKLQESEDALQHYGQSAGLLFTDEKNNVSETKLMQLQDELSKAQADRVQKQSTYELINKATTDELAQMVGNPALQDAQLKLTDLKRQLAEASALMTPGHYRVKQLSAQIAEMEVAINGQRNLTANRVSDEYRSAQRREELLQGAYDRQAQLVSTQEAKASRYNVLKNEVETNRQLYGSMLQRVKGVSIASAMPASNVVIFDPAEAPRRPYKPKTPLNTAIGFTGGLLLACLYLFTRSTWDQSLRLPGQVGMLLNVPELGAIPSLETRRLRQPLLRRSRLLQNEPDLLRPQGIELAMAMEEGGSYVSEQALQMADSFRAIFASVLLANGKQKAPKVVVVTSPSAQEGKTTTATNLAVVLAATGKKVLLIDSDLRRPRLHELFALPNKAGFGEMLTELSIGRAVQPSDWTQPTTVRGLDVLTSGRKRSVASNLIYSLWISELFAKLQGHYDTILIDTAPVLPVADARVLGRNADGVVLVCRAGSTNRENAKIALERLIADGVHVIGTVLNDFDPQGTYKGQYYGRVYSAGPNYKES